MMSELSLKNWEEARIGATGATAVYLDAIRKLYWICSECNRLVSPGESFLDSFDGKRYCTNCATSRFGVLLP